MSSTTSSASAAAVPLTTSFIPPASCDRQTWVSSDCQLSTCKGIYNIVRLTDSNCFPSGWETSQTAFSPGLICPSGYSINTQQTVTQGVGAIETQASCCPVYVATVGARARPKPNADSINLVDSRSPIAGPRRGTARNSASRPAQEPPPSITPWSEFRHTKPPESSIPVPSSTHTPSA